MATSVNSEVEDEKVVTAKVNIERRREVRIGLIGLEIECFVIGKRILDWWL